MNCDNCNRGQKPYLTAYEIAVKHGYKGTEAEWIKTLQSVYTAKVTGEAGYEWECSDTYADLIEKTHYCEVHLLTPEGLTAFCHGIGDSGLKFQTLPYEDDDLGSVFKTYMLSAADVGTFVIGDAYAPAQGSVEKSMLATALKNQIDGAVQRSAQATKTADMTNPVGIDSNGKQWAAGYIKPDGGIPKTDFATAVQEKLETAGIDSIVFTYFNGAYEIYDSTFAFTNTTDLIQQIEAGRNVRIVIMNTGDTYPAVHVHGAESLARVYFAGPTVDGTGGTYSIALEAFELKDSGSSISLSKVVTEPL